MKLISFALTGLLLLFSPLATAQTFPDKPIRLIVPFAAGGLADITMRIVGEKLSERLGQRIIIDNRPSGGGIAAAQAVAQSPADGYTLIVLTNGTAISVSLYKALPFDPVKDFVPISSVAYFDLVLLVDGKSPIKNVKDLLATARSMGGKMNIGTINPGSTQNLSAELFKSVAGIDALIVPFRSSPEVQTALLRGDITVGFESYAALKGAIDDGQLRAIATSGTNRSLPNIPTVKESGVPNYEVVGWNAIFAPAGTPADVVAKLNKGINEVVALPEVKQRILDLGTEPRASTPQEILARLQTDIKKWGAVIEQAKIEKR
ncbi:MAG TPA: tripartite tricarboxylate transporter substrate binding protein [Xanthobacteraceae bacterium]|nr:tripartite tricarboxylate transporter substrate binding protein [Xanthobacteraceae bacterium]